MAQYKPSFVDTSGMTQGLINGINQAAEIKFKQDQLVQKQLEDYQDNYDAKKLRDSDLPDFISSFKQYKDAALRYSRLNQAGAKPEEIALASALKDKALNNMNTIYKNSATAKNLINERIEYRNNLYKQNRSMPSQVSDELMYLTTKPASEMDFSQFDSPYKLPLTAGKDSLNRLAATLKAIPLGEGVAYEQPELSKKVTITGYGDVAIPYMVTPKLRSRKAMMDAAGGLMAIDSGLANTAKDLYDEIQAGLNIPEDTTDPLALSQRKIAMDKYQRLMQGSTDENEFTPALVLAGSTGLLEPTIAKQKPDETKFKAVLQDMKSKLGEKKYRLAAQSLGLQFDKFGYTQEKDMLNNFLKAGSENVPSVQAAAKKRGVDLKDVRQSQINFAKSKKGKGSRLNAFTGQ